MASYITAGFGLASVLAFGCGANRICYHLRIKIVSDSIKSAKERTTQYMSHGLSCAGSVVRSALYEAKIGKRTVMIELLQAQHRPELSKL